MGPLTNFWDIFSLLWEFYTSCRPERILQDSAVRPCHLNHFFLFLKFLCRGQESPGLAGAILYRVKNRNLTRCPSLGKLEKGFYCLSKPVSFCLGGNKGKTRKANDKSDGPLIGKEAFSKSILNLFKELNSCSSQPSCCQIDKGRMRWMKNYFC